jgi:ribosomal protein S18 acetylase RimI-like enzyme
MSIVLFRFALASEHDKIVRLARCSPYTRDFSNRVMFSSDSAYEKGWVRVAEAGGKLIGFTCIREKVREPVVSLYFIAVCEGERRNRVAATLLDEVMRVARHRRMALNCAKDNEAGLAFYAREGFTRTGESLKGHGWRLEKTWPL